MSENTNLKIALDNAADLLSNNNLNECIEQLEEILAIHPHNLEALSLLLDINIKQNKVENALGLIKKLIQLDPKNKEYQEKLIKVYQFLNDDQAYQSALIEFHKQFPSITTARLISNIYIENDREEESDQVIQNFFESDKTY